MSRFSDEEIAAYLDGEADPPLRERLEAQAAVDAELQGRIEALTVDKQAIAAAFDALLVTAPPPPAPKQASVAAPSSAPPWRGFAALAGTAAACLAIGFGLGSQFAADGGAGSEMAQAGLANWRDYAAAYHALYVTDTLAYVADDAEARQRELERAGRAVGLQLDAVSAPLDQLQFRRAQVLGFEGRALVQVAFLSDNGKPFALCVIRSPGARASAVAVETRQNMAAASWSQPDVEFLLIGGDDSALTKRAAEALRDRLAAS